MRGLWKLRGLPRRRDPGEAGGLEAEETSDLPGGLLPESWPSWGIACESCRINWQSFQNATNGKEAKGLGGIADSQACACQKECNTGGPEARRFVSISTDSFCPESIVRHKLVLSTDGVGLYSVPASVPALEALSTTKEAAFRHCGGEKNV